MTDLAQLLPAATELIARCTRMGLTIATAESCTGGLVAGTLTEVPGSSAVVERGFVTYSNIAKTDMLGVPEALLANGGAVSEGTARAMAEGALKRSEAHLVVAVTGIAGPGGGSPHKPIGLVHFAAVRRGGEIIHREQRFGDIGRSEVRLATVREALAMLDALAR
ncbi:MAG TPA: CinA family protein [Bauldia sp.]